MIKKKFNIKSHIKKLSLKSQLLKILKKLNYKQTGKLVRIYGLMFRLFINTELEKKLTF